MIPDRLQVAVGTSLALGVTAGNITTIKSIAWTPVASGVGAQVQCGRLTITDNGVVLWEHNIIYTSSAATQGKSEFIPVNLKWKVGTNCVIGYTAVTNGTSALISVVWQSG